MDDCQRTHWVLPRPVSTDGRKYIAGPIKGITFLDPSNVIKQTQQRDSLVASPKARSS